MLFVVGVRDKRFIHNDYKSISLRLMQYILQNEKKSLLIALSYQMVGLFLLQRFADKAVDISR